jgi:transcriptional regulator with XRE-family HTH domain
MPPLVDTGAMGGELATSLRAWRARVTPDRVDLPVDRRRRVPGLRRQELATMAGISVEYLVRLEQGRARHPSVQVVESLARALRLTPEELAHLRRLSGHAMTGPGTIDRHLSPAIWRILDRLVDLPVQVVDASWEVLARNRMGAALLGPLAQTPGRERNIAWRLFNRMPTRFVRTTAETRDFEAEIVADLRHATSVHPRDDRLADLVSDLRRISPRFEDLWSAGDVHSLTDGTKTVQHPEAGPITLACDVLTSAGSGLRIIVYSADPESVDGQALQFVGVLGDQPLAVPAD